MDSVQLPKDCGATTTREFTFNHKVPRSSWYSFNQPCRDERLSRSWYYLVVLKLGLLDWYKN